MSIGNLNTQGDKKNNFSYQKAVLDLLNDILIATGGGGIPATETPSISRVTNAAGSPITNAKSVTIYNSGAANGLVMGQVIKAGEAFTWSVSNDSNVLANISYDGTGTELVIAKIE